MPDQTNIPETPSATSRRGLMKGVAAMAPVAMMAGGADAATPNRSRLQRTVEAGKDASVARIRDWIANPTIAAQGLNIQQGAQYMEQLARDAGFQHTEIVQTDGSPGVFATLDVGAPKTVGVYFMYDVKQFDPAEWSSPPLEGRIIEKEGFGQVMMGRGAVNQKGPQGAFLAALHAMRAAGITSPVNIVLVCEGEEEIGSPHFHQIVRRPDIMAALQRTQGVFIPSASQETTGAVTVELGAKGIIECELTASGARWGRGPARDVHSSLKAMLDSPVWRLVHALETLVSEDGNTVAIEGWYENVRAMTARELELVALQAREQSEADFKRVYGVQHFIDDLPWEQALQRLASQPTVNIEGLVAGYTGPGGKTVLPGSGAAKLDFRLVPNQTRAEAERKLRAHLDAKGFSDVEVNVTGGYDPTETAENSRLVQAQLAVCRSLRIETTLTPRSAGSWPGAVFTAAPVSVPAAGFGLGFGTGAHAPDEYFVIDSSNRHVLGLTDVTLSYIDFLYELAR
ncbi:MAG: M20/M25/M40 family metallo-hydrolase [Hyphomonadaceae bacterium]|nr:M20/M25/M40 family metallo-hydrolase [Hyphomonadaceae bacterium]